MFGLAEGKDLFSLEDGAVSVNADLLSVSFALLSRYEETCVDKRDKYGRFAYSDSLVEKYNLIDIPVVDEYAMLLRKFVCDNFPAVSISPRKPKFIPTHDVDFLFRFPNFGKAVKTIAGDLFKRKSLRMSCKSLALILIKAISVFSSLPTTVALKVRLISLLSSRIRWSIVINFFMFAKVQRNSSFS